MTSRMQRTLLPEIVPLFQQLGQLSLKPGEAFMIRVERLKVFKVLVFLGSCSQCLVKRAEDFEADQTS